MSHEEEAIELAELELQERARHGLLSFTLFTKPDYQVNWHHQKLAAKLTAFARGDIKFLMVFMPPRHGKSELVSRRLPAFLHGLYPDAEIMAASYLDSLAGDMTTDVQSIIDSDSYQKVFPGTKIYPWGTKYSIGIRNSSEHHIVEHRGKYRGQGVGGSFTGKGANFIIVDDPIKGREIADSLVFRNRLWDFWKEDLFSRLETDIRSGKLGQVLITQTRWHQDDLSGRLIEQMKSTPSAIQWEIVNYPAIRVDIDDPTDPRQLGEPLWPKKYNVEQLEQIKASIGTRGWSSLYQQNPTPDGGGLFREEMFEFVDMPTKFDYTVIHADTAYKDKQENDFTVFTAFGINQDKLFIIDVLRDRIKASDIETPACNFINKYQQYGFRGAYIEPKGHGIYLNQMLPRKGILIPSETQLKEFYADRHLNKVERANNAIPHLSNHKIYINRNISIKEDLVAECLGFPNMKHDDFVDTLIDGIKYVYGRKISILDVL